MTVQKDSLISVCLVIRNDRDMIESLLASLSATLKTHYAFYEIILVDNHSVDDTAQKIKSLQAHYANIRLIRLSRTYSQETALTAGLDNSIGDFVIVFTPRYDKPEFIPRLVEKSSEGYDIVIVRQDAQKRYKVLDRMSAKLAYSFLGMILGNPVRLDESSYRIYSRRVVNALIQIRRKRRYLKYFNSLIGFPQTYIEDKNPVLGVPFKEVRRLEALSLVMDVLISNSALPLRFAALLGILASFLAFAYVVYILAVTLFRSEVVEGWLTTNLVMATLFLLLFIILAILSEYIARILDETKDEPLYFIEYENNSKVSSYSLLKERDDTLNVVEE